MSAAFVAPFGAPAFGRTALEDLPAARRIIPPMSNLLYLARDGRLDDIERLLASLPKKPPTADILEAAYSARKYPEVKARLVDMVMGRKVSAKGWNDAAAAAIGGTGEHLALAEKRKADFGERSKWGTPLKIAFEHKNTEFIRAAVTRHGQDLAPYLSPVALLSADDAVLALVEELAGAHPALLVKAVSQGRLDEAERLLAAGVPFDDDVARAMRDAVMVPFAVAAGWDPARLPEKKPGQRSIWREWAGVGSHQTVDDKATFFHALADAGVVGDTEALVDLLDYNATPEVIDAALRLARDLHGKVSVDGKPTTLIEAVLPELPLAILQRLVAAGAKLPGAKYRVPPDALEASAKKKWLKTQGVQEKRLSPAQLLDLPELDASEIEAALRERDGLFGLTPGMSKAEAKATGLADTGRLCLEFEGADLARIDLSYSVQSDSAIRVGDAIARVFTERWGEPSGADIRRWRAGSTVYTVRARRGGQDSTVEVSAEQGAIARGKRPDDLGAFLDLLNELLPDLSHDTLDGPAITRVDGHASGDDLELKITLEGGDVRELSYSDPPLDAEGRPADDFVEAILAAAADS